MRDRDLLGSTRVARPALAALAALGVVSGCITAAPFVPATDPPPTFAVPPAATRHPTNPDDELRIVDGYVVDSTGNALPDATVKLLNVDGQEIDETTTGATGAYGFATLAPTTLTLVASSPGFEPVERTLAIDTSLTRSFAADLRLTRTGDQIAVGSNGGIARTTSGAAVAFAANALADSASVSATDLTMAPPTDQLPTWDDGLERSPIGWLRVSLGDDQPATPALVVLPLSEAYDPGSVLEVRSYDEAHRTWSDETSYAVVGQSGTRAIASADHFSDAVVFTKRSRRIGNPTPGPDRELSADIDLADGDEDCRNSQPITISYQTPTIAAQRGVTISVPKGSGTQSWVFPYSQQVPGHTVFGQVQNVSYWAVTGQLTVPTRNQVFQTEVAARTTADADAQSRRKIAWPAGASDFVSDVLKEFGPVAIPDGVTLTLPTVMRRRDFISELKTFEYTVTYDFGTPRWVTSQVEIPCPSNPTPTVSPATGTETPTPSAQPPATPPPTTTSFSISASGLVSTSVQPTGDEPHCLGSLFASRSFISFAGFGTGGDGARYGWELIVNAYSGPGTYSSDINGHFDTAAGDPRNYGWGSIQPGVTNTITINTDERSGSFDLTIRPVINAQVPPTSNLHMTGTFSCELRTG